MRWSEVYGALRSMWGRYWLLRETSPDEAEVLMGHIVLFTCALRSER